MRAGRTIPGSVVWCLKNRIAAVSTATAPSTLPSHGFRTSSSPNSKEVLKTSDGFSCTAHRTSFTLQLLASLCCLAIGASYLFSLALALKSSITFLNRVTVKSPPSASSAIILWEGNPLLWFDMANPSYLLYHLLLQFFFSFMILNNTLLFKNCCDWNRELSLY